jgi:hypothetical protein
MLVALRANGISIRAVADRLIVEGSPGKITPEIRTELFRFKQDLLAALELESSEMLDEDPTVTAAIAEVAGLLALAYKRYSRAQRISADPLDAGDDSRLALSLAQSVHGVDKLS